jgi:spermidine synthase
MSDCGAACRVELGDARLSLARSREQFDVLILDAFSSDAIPVHLLTREALQIYLDRLSPGGVIAFHISNRHLDLRPILGALAADTGLQAISQLDAREERERGHLRSNWLVMAREPDALDKLKADPRWATPAVGTEVWTDDFSNVFKALLAG